MKVIVADKISERGVQVLKEQPGWNVVLTTKDTLEAEIADADALIVRSATKVTAELLDKCRKLRAVGRAGPSRYERTGRCATARPRSAGAGRIRGRTAG